MFTQRGWHFLPDECVENARGIPGWAFQPLSVSPQVHHVTIGSQAYVVSQVPAWMIRIIIEHDFVRVPEPVQAEAEIERRNAEVGAAKPETLRTAAFQPVDMMRANAATEVPVLPGMIQMVVWVIAPGVVANPVTIVMNVRRIGMLGYVAKVRTARTLLSVLLRLALNPARRFPGRLRPTG